MAPVAVVVEQLLEEAVVVLVVVMVVLDRRRWWLSPGLAHVDHSRSRSRGIDLSA